MKRKGSIALGLLFVTRAPRFASLLAACGLALTLASQHAAADPPLVPEDPYNALAAAISRLIEDAIPLEYDKQKDWGATTNISTGWNIEGKPFHWHARKRERTVNHGVWKHYRLKFIEPEKNLVVELTNLRPVALGRVALTLTVDARLDAWSRAKVYRYGVHLIAVEMEGDMRVRLVIEGELGIEMRTVNGSAAIAVAPVVLTANLAVEEFNLRRISNAHGPLVDELGDGVRRIVEDELNGPRLVEKLNRAIDKKRDRLTFRPAELLETDWWPLGPGTESR
jgi:hypothetical protein